ncbi:hypothetical protein EV702DRAFT_1196621 [Suillus placidus]|uniref:HAT C-terminal dimerisation domain-containing protein n=1 Tax=Suillus placidus TaxID=48579 RepID=A0A9P6ZWS2_9AGAM|nr:hypothetical protein EV702DRAFT_1196621 [Suillus placidus]
MSSTRRADGSLKDATEIVWYNDADDDSPIPPPPLPPPAHNGTLNSFIRRSGRATKPTEKIHETASSAPVGPSVTAPPSLACQGSYGHNWMRNSVKSRIVNDTATRRPHQELEDYLDAPLEDVDNVVAWWGHHSAPVAVELMYQSW